MMGKMIAVCGLDCAECPGYLATQANDTEKIAEVAIQWTKEFNVEIKPEDVWCDGCLDTKGRKCSHCAMCEMRACGMGRGFSTCAECDEYACEKLAKFFEMVPFAKDNLDAIRAKL